jgi:hypothetical protein
MDSSKGLVGINDAISPDELYRVALTVASAVSNPRE